MSEESKYTGHTPGPWDACEFASPPNTFYVQAHGQLLIGAGKQITGPDARLIADAPRLLEERDALRQAAQIVLDAAGYAWERLTKQGRKIGVYLTYEQLLYLQEAIRGSSEPRRGDLDESRSRCS